MKNINFFTLGSDDESIERYAALFYLNETTGLKLEGKKIVGQYAVDNFYLLITTKPIPWGENVLFYLLNLKLELVDELSIGGDFDDSFFLSDLEIMEDGAIEFFISGIKENFRLVVLTKPKFNFPNLNPYSIVSRPALTKQLMTNLELRRI
jgi:hypothetical protein